MNRVCSFSVCFIFVLLISEFFPVLSQDSLLPTLPPTEVGRSDRVKRCPAEFQAIGKECLKVVRVGAESTCPTGSEITAESSCAQYSGKSITCPPDFPMVGGRCERRTTTNPTQVCPDDTYTLLSDGMCSKSIIPPPLLRCPPNSIPLGDSCIIRSEQEPEFACPPGYTSEGKTCRIEELYNCTPARTEIPSGGTFSVPSNSNSIVPPAPSTSMLSVPATNRQPAVPSPAVPLTTVPTTGNGGGKRSRFPGFGTPPTPASPEGFRSQVALGMNFATPQRQAEFPWRRTQSFQARTSFAQEPASKEFVPQLINYVVQATCKRVRTIAAQKLCATGVLSGKMCSVEVEVPPILINSQSQDTVYQQSQISCPPNFVPESSTVCSLIESANVNFVCPEPSQDAGDRCVTYSPPVRRCTPPFVLDTDTACVATFRAAPVTEFTVRFACVGKECENH